MGPEIMYINILNEYRSNLGFYHLPLGMQRTRSFGFGLGSVSHGFGSGSVRARVRGSFNRYCFAKKIDSGKIGSQIAGKH